MGYDNTIFFVENCKMHYSNGLTYSKFIASVEIHKRDDFAVAFQNNSKKASVYFFAPGGENSGNEEIVKDRHDEPLTEMSVKDFIKMLSLLPGWDEYIYTKIAMEVALSLKDKENVLVLHYGH